MWRWRFGVPAMGLEMVGTRLYVSRIRPSTNHTTHIPEAPSTQYVRTLVPKAIKGMDFGTRVPQYWVLGPSGTRMISRITLLSSQNPDVGSLRSGGLLVP